MAWTCFWREEHYVEKRVKQLAVEKHKRGLPKRRWKNCIREDLEVTELKEEDTVDKESWRATISTGDAT